MDENELSLLSPEQQERKKDFETLFGSPGWSRLVRELTERAVSLRDNAINVLNTEKELFAAKGQMIVLLTLINFEANIEAEFNSIIENAEFTREEELAGQGSNA